MMKMTRRETLFVGLGVGLGVGRFVGLRVGRGVWGNPSNTTPAFLSIHLRHPEFTPT